MRIAIFLIVLMLVGCGESKPDAHDIESEIEKWLSIDVPSEFKIIENNYSWGIGDDLYSATIEYDEKSYMKFINAIDLRKWNKGDGWHQLIIHKNRKHYSYDYFSIFISPEIHNKIIIQYGSE